MTEQPIPAAFTKPTPDGAAMTYSQIMAKAKPAERVTRICLAGDLLAERQLLEQQINELAQTRRARVRDGDDNPDLALADDDDPIHDLQDQLADVLEQMRGSMATFRFRALPRSAWSALRKKYETGKGELDMEGLAVPMVAQSSLHPKMTEAEVADLFEVLNTDQQQDLFAAAWAANTGAVDVPFSLPSLAGRRPRGSASS